MSMRQIKIYHETHLKVTSKFEKLY